jgi:hypothetical protein
MRLDRAHLNNDAPQYQCPTFSFFIFPPVSLFLDLPNFSNHCFN